MSEPTIAIAIATSGRREVLRETLVEIDRQTRRPDWVGVCPAAPEDLDMEAAAALPFQVDVVTSSQRGLCHQRNALITLYERSDIILFLDDDFVMAEDYIENCVRVFRDIPDVALLTGFVIEDGVTGPGFTTEYALRVLARDRDALVASPLDDERLAPIYNGYGCNLAVRTAVLRENEIMFDEALKLYTWLEDVDFSRRVARHGRQVKTDRCRGVHMGVKRGRTSGLRLGYSQIANPVYLLRKGTMGLKPAVLQMGRNLLANFVRIARPEPWVDRRGRVKGNLLALGDLIVGRLRPARVSELE